MASRSIRQIPARSYMYFSIIPSLIATNATFYPLTTDYELYIVEI